MPRTVNGAAGPAAPGRLSAFVDRAIKLPPERGALDLAVEDEDERGAEVRGHLRGVAAEEARDALALHGRLGATCAMPADAS